MADRFDWARTRRKGQQVRNVGVLLKQFGDEVVVGGYRTEVILEEKLWDEVYFFGLGRLPDLKLPFNVLILVVGVKLDQVLQQGPVFETVLIDSVLIQVFDHIL